MSQSDFLNGPHGALEKNRDMPEEILGFGPSIA
jgi:hypothetical protein